jgi:hypothetical protein
MEKIIYSGGCHCAAVRFELLAPEALELGDCNCSMCRRSGYLHLVVPKADFQLTQGEESLTSYRFNTETANHLFCSTCGIKSFYVPRSHPTGISVNARCLDSYLAVTEAVIHPFDGQNWEKHVHELKPLPS